MTRFIPRTTALALALLALSTPALAAPGLVLDLQADPEPYVLGEPVVLTVSLRNVGTRSVEVGAHLAPDFANVEYFVTPPARPGETARTQRFRPWAIKEPAAPTTRLESGQALEELAPIFYGGGGWTFGAPGTYLVRAVYRGELSSNLAVVEVEEPAEPAVRDAAETFLGSPEVGRFLILGGGDHLAEGMARLERVARARGTPHAVAAELALGINLSYDHPDFRTGRLRRAHPARALAHLEEAKRGAGRLDTTLRSRQALAGLLERSGQQSRAAAERHELEQVLRARFPERAGLLRRATARE
jgi:hypothetical protein